jgi:hypothetical protein
VKRASVPCGAAPDPLVMMFRRPLASVGMGSDVKKKQRGVTLNAETYERFAAAARAEGESVAAWLTEAGETRRRRQLAEATVAFCARPEIAAQVAAYTGWAARDAATYYAGFTAALHAG